MNAPWNKDRAVGQKKPFSLQDIKTITQHLQREKRYRDLTLFCLGVDTMLRGSDLLRLRLSDVMQANRHPKSEFIWNQQKTKSPVVAAITPFTQSAICAHSAIAKLDMDDFLFVSDRSANQPLSTNYLRRLVKKWADIAGLEPAEYSSHSLRRSKPSHLYREGVRPEMLQLLLGHKSIQSTTAYLGIERNEALDLARKYDCFKEV